MSSSSGPLAVILGIALPAVLISLVCCIILHEKRRKAKDVDPRLNNHTATVLIREGETVKDALARDYKRRVDEMVTERIAYEAQTGFGEPVWVSIYAWGGQFKHWALITGGWKYELRQEKPSKRNAKLNAKRDADVEAQIGTSNNQTTGTSGLSGSIGGHYGYSSSPYTISDERRRAALATHRDPVILDEKHGIHLSIIMIGWTRKSREEILEVCNQAWDGFGSYSLIFNNCQHFLRKIAHRVVDTKSKDWHWFYTSTLSTYRWFQPPGKEPPDVMAGVWLRRLEEMCKEEPALADILEPKMQTLRKFIKEQRRRGTTGGGGGGGVADGGGGGGGGGWGGGCDGGGGGGGGCSG